MRNGSEPAEPKWPRLLSLAVHEFRTPISVVAGYIRMLLKNSAGPLNDKQRRLLLEAEKSTARLAALVDEMSDLAKLEAGGVSMHSRRVDLGAVLEQTIASMPPLQDREVTIRLENDAPGAAVKGDAERLRSALSSILLALRRELVASSLLVVRLRRTHEDGGPALRVAVAGDEQIDTIDRSDGTELGTFDEWRGGCGLGPAVARRILGAHQGRVWSPARDPRAAAVLMLPEED